MYLCSYVEEHLLKNKGKRCTKTTQYTESEVGKASHTIL